MQSSGDAEIENAWLLAPFIMKLLENELLTNRKVKRKNVGYREQEIQPR